MKNNSKKKFLFIIISILLLILILNIFNNVNASNNKKFDKNIPVDETHIFVLSEGIIQNKNKFIVPPNSSLIIKDPVANMQITLPTGTFLRILSLIRYINIYLAFITIGKGLIHKHS